MLTVYKNIFHSGPPIKIEYYEEEREKGVQVRHVLTEPHERLEVNHKKTAGDF